VRAVGEIGEAFGGGVGEAISDWRLLESPFFLNFLNKLAALAVVSCDCTGNEAACPSLESLRVKNRPCAEFSADIALTLRVRLVTFPQDVKIFKKSLMDGDPALWRLSQRRFS
jgi:hypothetical protein